MARKCDLYSVSAKWKGAFCDLEVLPTKATQEGVVALRIPALMPEPLYLTDAEARWLSGSILAILDGDK